ncbi:hypothetical protein KIPE111705_42925 [Kibdelosporangium persicum]|uniref:hypothetical protein n=1 Tax=Kibdelosporangium persicum TaxID=2698649 RepID=UPI0015634DE8|nr:hypothetical protein [Kibdelosporangium persicum]
MHKIIASPFLTDYLVLRPDSRQAIKIGKNRYAELLGVVSDSAAICPTWLVNAASQRWGIDLSGEKISDTALVRQPSPYGFGRASYELNLGCDPHGMASICKVGRDPKVPLMDEGIGGLTRLGDAADALMLRTGGCSGCALSGSCWTCRPLAKLYQEAKAPLTRYCQHGGR